LPSFAQKKDQISIWLSTYAAEIAANFFSSQKPLEKKEPLLKVKFTSRDDRKATWEKRMSRPADVVGLPRKHL
jgi:hypothetical protein